MDALTAQDWDHMGAHNLVKQPGDQCLVDLLHVAEKRMTLRGNVSESVPALISKEKKSQKLKPKSFVQAEMGGSIVYVFIIKTHTLF